MFANFDNQHIRTLDAVSRRDLSRKQLPPRERVSDSWPDYASELSDDDIKASARKNKFGRVLGEALGAVVYSIGLVALLAIVVQLFR